MSEYPEHDKQALVMDQTQAIGEFLEWLNSQGVQLMTWREDLTDSRPTDRDCATRFDPHGMASCDPQREGGQDYLDWRRSHCLHWSDAERSGAAGEPGTCCRCGKGEYYEVTGISAHVHESRSTTQLLADWAGIDLSKIEAEKRAMLAKIRADAEVPAS